jgi:hypothetical protein
MTLNVDLPRFYCLLRKEYLYDCRAHFGEFERCCVFGLSSLEGRALGFHAMLENGAVIWRLPLSAFCHREDAPPTRLDVLELWDCFSHQVSVHEFGFLSEQRCEVWLKDRSLRPGLYMFTVDWYGSADATDAGDGGHKCAHLIRLDDGNFAAQPNNRIRWFDPAFVTPFTEKPDYLTNTRIWKVESYSEWETGEGMFYDVVERRLAAPHASSPPPG